MDRPPAEMLVTIAETDTAKWWAGTRYDVRFRLAESGWSTDRAATFVMDIAEDEVTSPGSSSPWSGWVGWYGDEIVITWMNPEVDTLGVKRLSGAIDIDDEPTNEQWDLLARLVVTTCFESGQADG